MRRIAPVFFFAAIACAADTPDLLEGLYAEITTPRGVIVAALHPEKAPLAVASFVGLAEGTLGPREGAPFFEGLKFHRVVPGFVVQGGDPLGTGEGGPGYTFPDEFVPGLSHDAAGVLSMANNGPDTNGSQFFLTLAPAVRLDFLHSVFGRVVRGLEVLPLIQSGDAMQVRIRRVGAAAEAFHADAPTFTRLVALAPRYSGPAEPGEAAFFDDPDLLLPIEPRRARAFNFKLANFARITGRKIFVRLVAKAPSETPEKKLGAHVQALASQLGVERDGVLLVYVAELNEWKLWIGDDLLPIVMGRPGDVAEFMRGGALHARKQALLAGARSQLAAESADSPAQRLKLACDAALAELLAALAPR